MTDCPSSPPRRRSGGREVRREAILEAARQLFAAEGLEGASLRAIALRAGYTPAALYFHFASKEAIYAALLEESLQRLHAHVIEAVAGVATPASRLRAAALAFFDYYAAHPHDLDLGFYLSRGGMRPQGLGPQHDPALNALLRALSPITEAARTLGADAAMAEAVTADLFAHATGLLLLAHTGRIRLFRADPAALMAAQVQEVLRRLSPQ